MVLGSGWWRCVIEDFHGGVALLGNLIEVVLGCGCWRCARGKCSAQN